MTFSIWTLIHRKCTVNSPHSDYFMEYTGTAVCVGISWGCWNQCWTSYGCWMCPELVDTWLPCLKYCVGYARTGQVCVCIYIFKCKYAYIRKNSKTIGENTWLRELSQRPQMAVKQQAVNCWSLSLGKWDFNPGSLEVQIKAFPSSLNGLKATFTSFLFTQLPAGRCWARSMLFRKTPNEIKAMSHTRGQGVNFTHDF